MIRIVLLPPNPDEPAPVMLVHPTGQIERGVLATEFAEHRRPMRTVLVVPGAEVLVRWVELPATNEAQSASAAAFLLEDEIAADREQVHMALGAIEPDGWRPVAVVDRLKLQGWLERAAALGVKPDVVAPDHLMLAEPEGEEAIAVAFGETLAVRGRRLALACEPDLLPLVLGERPWRLVDDVAVVEPMLAASAAAPRVNLLQGMFSRQPAAGARWRRAAALAAALLISPVLISTVQALRHHRAADAAEAEADARLRSVFPAAPASASPAALIGQRQTALRSGGEFAGSAAALFAAIERVEGVELEAFLYAPAQPMQSRWPTPRRLNWRRFEPPRATPG
jgi:general secretion pathway protein L